MEPESDYSWDDVSFEPRIVEIPVVAGEVWKVPVLATAGCWIVHPGEARLVASKRPCWPGTYTVSHEPSGLRVVRRLEYRHAVDCAAALAAAAPDFETNGDDRIGAIREALIPYRHLSDEAASDEAWERYLQKRREALAASK